MSLLTKKVLFISMGIFGGWLVSTTVLFYMKAFNETYFTHSDFLPIPFYLVESMITFFILFGVFFNILLKNGFPVSRIYNLEIGFCYTLLLILGDYYIVRPISTSSFMDTICSKSKFMNTYFADIILPFLIYPVIVFLLIIFIDWLVLNKISYLKPK